MARTLEEKRVAQCLASKKWREAHREQSLASQRRYQEENIEKCRESTRKYRDNNREKVRASGRETKKRWYAANREKALESRKKSEAKRRMAGGVRLHGAERQVAVALIYFRQRGLCPLCNRYLDPATRHEDHRVPIFLGGTNDIENIQLTHGKCNNIKYTKGESHVEKNIKYQREANSFS